MTLLQKALATKSARACDIRTNQYGQRFAVCEGYAYDVSVESDKFVLLVDDDGRAIVDWDDEFGGRVAFEHSATATLSWLKCGWIFETEISRNADQIAETTREMFDADMLSPQ